jgi:quercetin dioxygenase-like cupin family protein
MESVMKRFAPAIVAALGVFVGTAPAVFGQETGQHMMVLPSDLKWADVPSLPAGAKIAVIEGPMNQAAPFTVRLKFPKDYQIPAHSHPAIERVTVLSGTFHMGTGDQFDRAKTHPLPAGALAIMQNGTRHFAWTSDEVIVQLNGNGPWGVDYVNPADDPRKK